MLVYLQESKGELYAAYVIAQISNCNFDPDSIDLSQAVVSWDILPPHI